MLFSFTPGGTRRLPGEKLRIALMPAADQCVDRRLRGLARHG